MQIVKALDIVRSSMERHGISTNDRLVLGVSGGRDSMCMLFLLHQLGCPLTVAHVNYMLRGSESDSEEALVERTCKAAGIPCHTLKENIESYAHKRGMSIQEAARHLRYRWFEKIRQQSESDLICTAHHTDDSVETLLINLLRGTGIKGLTGIPEMRDDIFRPLLNLTRQDINAIVDENDIDYLEDSSNQETKYLRNKLRHLLFPAFSQVDPEFLIRIRNSMSLLEKQHLLYSEFMQELEKKLCKWRNNQLLISTTALDNTTAPSVILQHLLQPLGFNRAQCENIVECLQETGKLFHSETHEALIDRETIIVQVREKSLSKATEVNCPGETRLANGTLKITTSDIPANGYASDRNIELVDGSMLRRPLTVRTWLPGDSFRPLGMQGSQKVQDFLTNQKISLFDKRKTLVLLEGDEIIWLVGHRISEDFKLKENSESIYRLQWIPRQ